MTLGPAHRLVAVLVVASFLVFGALNVLGTGVTSAAAADKNDFNPGLIISDPVFYDSGAMSSAEIRAFIVNKGASCVAGEAACLKDYKENTGTWAAEAGLCSTYQGARGEDAATIIYKVATACGISPKVLLVLLEKEQSLVSGTRPTVRRYTAATGFGCPDTAPCDPIYAGFATQVHGAARQFKRYAATPTRWNYQAGRTNTVLWHPNTSCGSSQLYIENQATAALYIYTPYRPNAAALSNLYGSGDACSSYGNRNFWRIFTDWFGRPDVSSSLVRTAHNPDVYLISGSTKAHIPDLATLTALSPLGNVGIVSSSYLARFATTNPVTQIARDTSNGGIYVLAGGIKHHLSSCSLVDAWGGGQCARFTSMSSSQLALFATGTPLTDVVDTKSGKTFLIAGGTKREIYDDVASQQAGITNRSVVLPEATIAHLPYARPVVREDVVIKARSSENYWLVQNGHRVALPAGVRSATPLKDIASRDLDQASVNEMPASDDFTGLVTDAAGRTSYVLTETGLVPLGDSTTLAGRRITLSAGVIATLGVESRYDGIVFARPVGSSSVSVHSAGRSRVIQSWSDLVAISKQENQRILVVPKQTLDHTPSLGAALLPGQLVKSASSPDLFLIDGLTHKVHLESFSDSAQLGISSYTTVSASTLSTYTMATTPLSPIVQCGTSPFVGINGVLRARSAQAATPRTLPLSKLQTTTCSGLQFSTESAATGKVYVKGGGSDTVYVLSNSQKHRMASWGALIADNAGHPSLIIATLSPSALSRIPTGSPLG